MKKEIGLIALGMFVMLIIILGFNLHLRVRQLENIIYPAINRSQTQTRTPVIVPEVKK